MHFLHTDLTKDDKQKIKDKIRAQERKLNNRTLVISVIILIGLGFLTKYLIQQILSH